jgi:hypothetical protein
VHQQLTEQRKIMIHLQVGLLRYEEVYGPLPETRDEDSIPYFTPPAWLGLPKSEFPDDCPF